MELVVELLVFACLPVLRFEYVRAAIRLGAAMPVYA